MGARSQVARTAVIFMARREYDRAGDEVKCRRDTNLALASRTG
jgi:hypothetical protein